jgi:hypothetical protein
LSYFTGGFWRWIQAWRWIGGDRDAPDPHSARTGERCVQDGGISEPHPHLLAHEFQILSL